MKGRFNALDVAAIALELSGKRKSLDSTPPESIGSNAFPDDLPRSPGKKDHVVEDVCLINSRLQNIYEVVPHRAFLFKFNKSSGEMHSAGNEEDEVEKAHEGEKEAQATPLLSLSSTATTAAESAKRYLFVESGSRIHLTKHFLGKIVNPHGALSPFLFSLRKYLRGKRVTHIEQLGADRIIQFTFSNGIHLIFEFYATGNMILLKDIDEKDKDQDVEKPLHHDNSNISCVPTKLTERTSSVVLSCLRMVKPVPEQFKNNEPSSTTSASYIMFPGVIYPYHRITSNAQIPTIDAINNLLSLGKPSQSIRKLLATLPGLPLTMTDIWLHLAKIEPGSKKVEDLSELERDNLLRLYPQLVNLLDLTASRGGYCNAALTDYSPIDISNGSDKSMIQYETFHAAVDACYALMANSIQSSKMNLQERATSDKLERVESGLDARIASLHLESKGSVLQATAIEENVSLVGDAIRVIQVGLAAGMSWSQLESLLIVEKSKGNNPVANSIKRLLLKTNEIEMELPLSEGDNSHSASPSKPSMVLVIIDLGLSPYANARACYNSSKEKLSKAEKTLLHKGDAIAAAQRKISQKKEQKASGKPKLSSSVASAATGFLRKRYWFEQKFAWSISSENFLILAGRNAQENELLVKRYLKAGDVYVHADVHGAASVVVKAKTISLPNTVLDDNIVPVVQGHNSQSSNIPLGTLAQAASVSLAYSSAWKNKTLLSAYYVFPDQVSKTPNTGEYLSTGSFVIRGKRNYIPPSHLIFGFGILFKLGDAKSIEAHNLDRTIRQEEFRNESAKWARYQLEPRQEDEDVVTSPAGSDQFPVGPSLKEERLEMDEDAEPFAEYVGQSDMLSSLTGRPLATDNLLFAVVVCGPYDSMEDYKYKVKLLPGSLKKGKAVQEALHHFLHPKHDTNRKGLPGSIHLNSATGPDSAELREKALIKAIQEDDLIQAMLSNVRVLGSEEPNSSKENISKKGKSKQKCKK